MANPTIATAAFVKGLQAEFEGLWKMRETQLPDYVSKAFTTIPSDGRFETMHAWREPNTFKIWQPDKPRTFTGLSSVTKKIHVVNYENGVTWRENDEADNRSAETIMGRAREAGMDAGWIDFRAFIALITATADTDTITSVPTCIDGYAIYSASHEEHASGNAVTGTGVAATDTIAADWFSVIARYRAMRYPKATRRQYFSDAVIDTATFVIFCSSAIEQKMRETFESRDRIVVHGSNTAASTQENIVYTKFGQRVRIVPTSYITGNSWYVMMMDGGEGTPFAKIARQAAAMVEYNQQNSDRARDYKTRSISWDVRLGYGAYKWQLIIKVTNS